MTQAEWSIQKRFVYKVSTELPDAPDCAGYIYPHATYICQMQDGQFWLILGNYEAVSTDLNRLETELWEQWVKPIELE